MLLLLPLLLGCVPDDWNGQPYMGPTSTTLVGDSGLATTGSDGLEGTWVSEGSDLSDLLANEPFNYVRVDATFGTNGSYSVVGEDVNGDVWPLEGSFTASAGTPGTVTLDQTDPYEAIAEGIWQVDGGLVLTYEVVQTTPSYGFVAPTPGSGFGSTTGPGLSPGINVQTYRRVQ